MKIAVMGSHGTGKSTLVYQMTDQAKQRFRGLDIRVLLEVARECPFPINEEGTEAAQRWIFGRQVVREVELGSGHLLVCDRTVLDSLAYSEYRGFSRWVASALPLSVEWFRERYHRVYFLRPAFAPAADGFRSTDPKFQSAIDAILLKWIDRYKLRVIEATPAQALIDFLDWFEMEGECANPPRN